MLARMYLLTLQEKRELVAELHLVADLGRPVPHRFDLVRLHNARELRDWQRERKRDGRCKWRKREIQATSSNCSPALIRSELSVLFPMEFSHSRSSQIAFNFHPHLKRLCMCARKCFFSTMTTVRLICSQTICQKSATVEGRGACVATYLDNVPVRKDKTNAKKERRVLPIPKKAGHQAGIDVVIMACVFLRRGGSGRFGGRRGGRRRRDVICDVNFLHFNC